MQWLSPERYASELEAETARLAAAVSRQPPSAVVPDCPDWTVRDLVAHVGTGHRYAAGVIEQAATEPVPYQIQQPPAEQAAWSDWLGAGAQRLNAAVRKEGFEAEVWTFLPAHHTAGFWLRRMVHDEIVHRFDAEPDGELAPDIAADGIADLLLVFETIAGPQSRSPQWRQLAGAGETLLFSAADTADRWHVSLVPTGFVWRAVEAGADVTYRAPVAELLLMLNRRQVPGAGQVHGDRALLDRWLEVTRF